MKAVILFVLTSFLGLSVEASDMSSTYPTSSEISSNYSPEVCQFSLTSYSGTISNTGSTDYFKVGLSCPQEVDVRATVVVFINDEHAASKVVTIKAGNDYSDRVSISVGSSFKGERYRLVVQ